MTGVKAGRPHWWVTGLVLCLVVLGLGYFFLPESKTAVLPPAGNNHTPVDTREDAAAGVLEDLTSALEDGNRAAAVALAAPGDSASRRELADLVANVKAIGISDLSMRYVDEDAGRSTAAVAPELHGRAWVADVQVAWRIRGFDHGTSHLEVPIVFAQTKHGAAFVSARGDYGKQAPLWLLDRLSVQQSATALAMVAGGPAEARAFGRLGQQAVRDVRKVFPRWRGKLVVEVPRSQDELDRIVDSGTSYDAIAAVTAPVDGSLSSTTPTHIFVNPPVFDPLGPRGSQIVMSHEAAHVATKGAFSRMPTWLLEGFADYVALAHVNLPVQVTASQILAQVRKDGPPSHLPNENDFNSENTGLGASYEAAWLACRLIANTYGEAKLIAFYRAADQDSASGPAFRRVLGTTEAEFTARWRAELRALAG